MEKTKTRTRVAHMSLKDFRTRLHNYDTSYLECKDMRHRWSLIQPYERQPSGWVTRVLECDRCGTVRTDNYAILNNQRLARAGSSYRYPEGFSFRGLPQAESLGEVVRYEAYLRSLQNGAHDDGDKAQRGG